MGIFIPYLTGFPDGSDGKETACNAGEPGSTPGSGRSPGESNGYPLQWRNPWTEEPGELQSMGLQRVRNNWATNTHTHTQSHGLWAVLSYQQCYNKHSDTCLICASFSKTYIHMAVDIGLSHNHKGMHPHFPKIVIPI